jgi:hypothetical protein
MDTLLIAYLCLYAPSLFGFLVSVLGKQFQKKKKKKTWRVHTLQKKHIAQNDQHAEQNKRIRSCLRGRRRT